MRSIIKYYVLALDFVDLLIEIAQALARCVKVLFQRVAILPFQQKFSFRELICTALLEPLRTNQVFLTVKDLTCVSIFTCHKN